MKTRRVLSGILMLALVTGTGCGYSFGVVRHEGVESVYVKIFGYRELEHRREIEFDLAQAVGEEMISRSGLEITGPKDADAVLEGEILRFQEQVITEDRNNNVLESSVVIVLNLRLIRSDGAVLVDRRKLTERAEFSVGSGKSEQAARREVFNELAEQIVFALEGEW
ncbi:MAG: LPS assembly lipoprotein LptE [Planctomycetota bacterium]|nr:LPS assembly lipoprotein LptE [Planctomycetota bacterium]